MAYFKIQRKTGPKFSKIVGYKADGYVLFCPEEGKYYESRDVKFNEKLVFGDKYNRNQIMNWEVSNKEIDKRSCLLEFVEKLDEDEETSKTEGELKRKRGRPRKIKPSNEEQSEESENEDIEQEKEQMYALLTRLNEDPVSYREAMSTNERDQWTSAVREELKSMEENKVWKIIERPKIINGNKPNIIDSRWVLKKVRSRRSN